MTPENPSLTSQKNNVGAKSRLLVFCLATCARISARSFLLQIALTILNPVIVGATGFSASPATEATQGKGRQRQKIFFCLLAFGNVR